jgi:SsrA-binding protein
MTMKVLAKNRRANFDYSLTELLIGGLVLSGDEVKSLKAAHGSLKGSFISLRNNEAYLSNAHITPYANASNKADIDPARNRKLLLHRKQIDHLIASKQSGLSVVPTSLLLSGNLIKIEIGIGRGQKRYDKRESIKKRDTTRDLERQLKR